MPPPGSDGAHGMGTWRSLSLSSPPAYLLSLCLQLPSPGSTTLLLPSLPLCHVYDDE